MSDYNLPSTTEEIIDSRTLLAVCEEMADDRRALQLEVDECETKWEDAKERLELYISEEVDESEHDDLSDAASSAEEELEDAVRELAEWNELNQDDFEMLADTLDAIDQYSGGSHQGTTLIADSYMTRYAEEYADDIGAVDMRATWPTNHIDWEAAAEELKEDMSAIEYDGEMYWVR